MRDPDHGYCLHLERLTENKIRELESINAELEKVSSYSLLRKNDRLKAENAKLIKANIDVANINAELKTENAELREAAQALYDSKFKDPKTGNQCVAFCELEKMAALLQERGG